MGRFLRALGAGARGMAQGVSSSFGPSRFTVAGIPVRCTHCDGVTFDLRHALLNTGGMTFLRLDWANRQAAVLVCSSCSAAHWFLEEPERVLLNG